MIAWCWPKRPGRYWIFGADGESQRLLTLDADGRWYCGLWGVTREQLRSFGWRGIPWRIEVAA